MQNMVIQNMCFISTNKQLYLIYILDGSTDFLKYTLKIRNTIQEKIQHTFIQNEGHFSQESPVFI